MQAIHLALNAARALLQYEPSLALNVVFVFFGTCLTIWVGFHLSHLLSPLARGVTPSTQRTAADAVLMSYTFGAFYALFLMYALGGMHVYTPLALWAAVCCRRSFVASDTLSGNRSQSRARGGRWCRSSFSPAGHS